MAAIVSLTNWAALGTSYDLYVDSYSVKRTAADKCQVTMTVRWAMHWSSNKTWLKMDAIAVDGNKTINLHDGSGSSSGKSGTLVGTYSITKNSAINDKTITVTFKATHPDTASKTASTSLSFKVDVPAWPSWKVKYNKNTTDSVTGTFTEQTKWQSQNITLHAAPTRTGYTFKGWGTSASATSAAYSAGQTYSANSGTTLYAIWQPKTATVTYDKNTEDTVDKMPTDQTKTYDKNLTLSYNIPERTNYNFLGWATTSTGNVVYKPGDTYSTNTTGSSITLYAVWELAYTKPRIENLSIQRCSVEDRYNLTTETLSEDPGGTEVAGVQTADGQQIFYRSSDNLYYCKRTSTSYFKVNYIPSGEDGAADQYLGTTETVTISQNGEATGKQTEAGYDVYKSGDIYYYIQTAITYFKITRIPAGTLDDNSSAIRCVFGWSTDYDVTEIVLNWSPAITITHNDTTVEKDSLTMSASGTAGDVDVTNPDSLSFSPETTYTFSLTISDNIGSNTVIKTLSGAKFPIDVRRRGTGIAFNKPAELDGVMDIAFQTRLAGGLLHPVIPPETDLNDVITPNTYVGENVSSYAYVNCPVTSGTFTLEVLGMGVNGQILQRVTSCNRNNGRAFERIWYRSAGWSEWVCVSDYEGKLLWNGCYYMAASHTATLSEPVSKQRNGIVLVFSLYDAVNKIGKDQEMFEFFIPKYSIAKHTGSGRNFCLFGLWDVGAKYLYLHDTKIVGHEKNYGSQTVAGITYNNSHYVLRHVIGV